MKRCCRVIRLPAWKSGRWQLVTVRCNRNRRLRMSVTHSIYVEEKHTHTQSINTGELATWIRPMKNAWSMVVHAFPKVRLLAWQSGRIAGLRAGIVRTFPGTIEYGTIDWPCWASDLNSGNEECLGNGSRSCSEVSVAGLIGAARRCHTEHRLRMCVYVRRFT